MKLFGQTVICARRRVSHIFDNHSVQGLESDSKIHTETKDMIAHKLVNKPVLMMKKIKRFMIVSERLKPVRERWRRKISVNAIATSDATLSMLIDREAFTTLY